MEYKRKSEEKPMKLKQTKLTFLVPKPPASTNGIQTDGSSDATASAIPSTLPASSQPSTPRKATERKKSELKAQQSLKIFECGYCGKKFDKKKSLILHIQYHMDPAETCKQVKEKKFKFNNRRQKRSQRFKLDWKQRFPWAKESKKGPTWLICKYCNKELTCAQDGVTALKRHNNSKYHNENQKAVIQNMDPAETCKKVKENKFELNNKTRRRKQRFKLDWKQKFPWAKESKTGSTWLICKYCNKALQFAHDGVTALKRHNNSKYHKENQKAVIQHRSIKAEDFQKRNQESIQERARKLEIQVALFICTNDLPIALSEHLIDFLKKADIDKQVQNELRCKYSKTTGIVHNVTDIFKNNFIRH